MSEADSLVQQGIVALKAGQKQRARELLSGAVELNERHEQAWLWLSAAVSKPEEREICLENVLTINPNNSRARRGLEIVRKKLGPAPPKRSHEVSLPTPDEAERRRPTLQTPASWQKSVSWQEAVAQSQAESQGQSDSGSFLASLGVQVPAQAERPKKKRSLLGGASEGAQARAAAKQRSKERGLLALLDAWISALIFDGRGAYDAERDVATIGRTTLNVIIAAVASSFLFGVGLFIFFYRLVALVDPTALPGGVGFIAQQGTSFAGTLAVLWTPFLVIFFFTVAFAMQKAAGLLGSDLDFFESAHLFSISFAPSAVLLSFLLMLLVLIFALIIGQVETDEQGNLRTDPFGNYPPETAQAIERFDQLWPVFTTVFGIAVIYSLVMWAHGLGVAHDIGIIGGVLAVIVGLVLAVILSGLVCCGLNFLMSVGNPNIY